MNVIELLKRREYGCRGRVDDLANVVEDSFVEKVSFFMLPFATDFA